MTEPEMSAPAETPTEPVAVVTLVLQEIHLSEARIVKKIDENASYEGKRWRSHDEQHDDHDRIHERIEESIAKLTETLDAHLTNEREKKLVFDARIGPFKSVVLWARSEWRTVALAILIVSDLAVRFASDVYRAWFAP